jgi:HEAT repeats
MQWMNRFRSILAPRKYKWPLFAILFCCFASAILGDSTAESLLLAHCDMRSIPGMFLVNAVFLFISSSVLMSLIDRVDRGRFFMVLTFGHCGMLLLIKCALLLHMPFLYPFLFSYAYVTKILLFLMFWTLANDLVDSRRASAEFPFVAAGGTLGAIAVSFAVPWLMKVTAAENLLLVWSALVMLLGVLFLPVQRSFGVSFKAVSDKQKHAERSIKNILDDLKLVKQEPLLWNMAIFYFLLFFVVINQQFAFYAQLKGHLSNAKQLASFLGYFNGSSMFATFLLQIFVAGYVIKKIGSTRAMLFLPAVLCCVFVVLAYLGFFPGMHEAGAESNGGHGLFWCVVLGMGLRVAFFDSFFSPNFQVFFSSLPHDVRGRGKLSIEGVVKPLAIVCASIWLLFVAPMLPFGVSMAILFYCSVGMFIQTFRIRKKYAESLSRNLTGFKSKRLSTLFNFVDLAKEENFLTTLSRALEKEEYEIKKYMIEILIEMKTKESIAVLLDYLGHCDEISRATIISSLGTLKKEDLRELFARYLHDPDERVVANSVLALGAYQTLEITGALEPFLYNPDNRVRANAVVVLWPMWAPEKRNRLVGLLMEMLESKNVDTCASGLYAMGELHSGEFLPRLKDLMVKELPFLISNHKIWKQYIDAVSKSGDEGALEVLLSLCDRVSRKKMNDVVASLGGLIKNGYPCERFLERLAKETYLHRSVMLKALYEGRVFPGKEHEEMLQEMALSEVKAVYSDWISLNTLDTKAELAGIKLLRMAIFEESINERLRNVVNISALLDKSGRIRAVVPRLYHSNRHVRAQAFELLDNVGDLKINRWLLRLLDTNDVATHSREGALTFKIRSKSLMAVVSEYINGHHVWLKECASYAASCLFAATADPRWERLIIQKT